MPWVVWLIFGLCLLPEVYLSGADFRLWGSPLTRDLAFDHFAFWAGTSSDSFPYYRAQPYLMFLTYGFLHGGLVHFGVNMLTLFSLGKPIARALGSWRFLVLYVVVLVAGGLGFAALPVIDVPMVGASGALFGLVGVLLAWEVQRRRARGLSLRPVANNVAILVGLNAVLWWVMNGQLAWQTHLGGFLAGWAIAEWLLPLRR